MGNWGTAGEKTCVPPSHLRVSHDQTTLWIDMSLSNADLLAVNTQERRTDECQPGTASKSWGEGWLAGGGEGGGGGHEGEGEIGLSRNL